MKDAHMNTQVGATARLPLLLVDCMPDTASQSLGMLSQSPANTQVDVQHMLYMLCNVNLLTDAKQTQRVSL